MNTDLKQENRIRWVFIISIIFKGSNGLLELVLGVLFLFTGAVSGLIMTLTQGELLEDPNDFIATHIQSLLPYVNAHAQMFAAAYFLIHGLVKIVLVWALLKNKLWAYPTSLAVLIVFLAYQIVRYVETQSIMLALLSIFDVFVIWLIWYEYRHIKKTA
jgi:uncharacterized membrane protein